MLTTASFIFAMPSKCYKNIHTITMKEEHLWDYELHVLHDIFFTFWWYYLNIAPSPQHLTRKCSIDFVYKVFAICCNHELATILLIFILHVWHRSFKKLNYPYPHIDTSTINLWKKENLISPKDIPWMNLATSHPFSTSKQIQNYKNYKHNNKDKESKFCLPDSLVCFVALSSLRSLWLW